MNKKTAYGSIGFGLMVALTLSPHSSVLAEEIDEIVVSATGIPTPVSQIGSSVDVITAEDLEQQQITYLQDALKLKGMNIPQSGGPGTISNVFMRGLPGRYTNLVIDGISMFDPSFSNQVLWNDVTTNGVGKVEILRGSQGVLYGSNTIAGVISQFTAIGGDDQQTLRAELGEYGTKNISLSSKGETEAGEYGFGISRFHTDGFSAAKAPDGNTGSFDDDAYDNTSINGKFRTYISEDVSFDVVLRNVEGKVETDTGANTDALNMWSEFRRNASRFAVNAQTGSLSRQFGFINYDNEIDNFSNSAVSWSQDTERRVFDYRGVLDADRNVQFVFGAGSDESHDGSNKIDIQNVYGLVQIRPADAVILTAAVRRDDHDLFGEHDTYRATAALTLADGFTTRAAYGTGFRAPTLSELYGYYGGDATLTPEESQSAELGADLQVSDALGFAFTGYYIVIEDKIDWVPARQMNEQLDGRSRVRGGEFAANLRASNRLSFEFDVSYTDSKKPDGSREVRVPRVQGSIAANYAATDHLQVGASVKQVQGVVDIGDAELDDYTLFDVRASYQLSDAVKAFARLENAADEDYETIAGYGTPGRAFYVGVTSSF